MSANFDLGSPDVSGASGSLDVDDVDTNDMSRLSRMDTEERRRYLEEIVGRMIGQASTATSVTPENPVTVIVTEGSGDGDSEAVFIAIIIVGSLVIIWFLVTIANSVYRFTSHRLLTVDGLGAMLERFVVTFSALMTIRRSSQLEGTQIRRLGEDCQELESLGEDELMEGWLESDEGSGESDSDQSPCQERGEGNLVDLESQRVRNPNLPVPVLSPSNPFIQLIARQGREDGLGGKKGIKIYIGKLI